MRSALIAILFLLTMAPAAGAASIAYIDGGEVWLSSLDGAQKVRLATPVVNSAGETEKWLAVAASDSGRIVAARNVPGRISRFSWFKVWEPNGTSTVEGPLNAPVRLGHVRLSARLRRHRRRQAHGLRLLEQQLVLPDQLRAGHLRPAGDQQLARPDRRLRPGAPDAVRQPDDRPLGRDGRTCRTHRRPTYGTDFTPWLDVSGTGLELRRTDVAANGQLAALELEQWNGGTQTIGKIAVVATQGVDQAPTFPAAVDCFVPASGVAKDVSLSADATRIAWTDDGGLKVAGAPTTAADPCALTSPPVVISPTASQGAIGGADVAAFLPASGQPPAGGPPPEARRVGAAPVATVPRKVTTKALAGAKGVPIKVKVARAGKVKISGTVPAKVLGRRAGPSSSRPDRRPRSAPGP